MKRYFLPVILLSFIQPVWSDDLQPLNIVASIRPLHSIAAAVLKGSDNKLSLLIDTSASVHGVQLLPSHLRRLKQADLLLWVGPEMETYLTKIVDNRDNDTKVIQLMQLDGIVKVSTGSHAGKHQAADDTADRHHYKQRDEHPWLHPENALRFARAISEYMIRADPANAERYRSNTGLFNRRVKAVEISIDEQLSAIRHVPYIALHNAYASFNHRFGLQLIASITTDPDLPAGLFAIANTRRHIEDNKVHCLVYDTPSMPRIMRRFESENTRLHYIDPIGRSLQPGHTLYPQLLEQMSLSFANCLSGK